MTETYDPDRQAVYYSEEIALEGTLYEEQLHSDDWLHLADELFGSDWWARNKIPVPSVEPTRKQDPSSCAVMLTDGSGEIFHVIRLAPNQISAWTLAHEAAHVATNYFYTAEHNPKLQSHGREFRACYLATALILLGEDVFADLYDQFSRRFHPADGASIITVPKPKSFDRYGIFPRWREIAQADAIKHAREQAIAFSAGPERVNGAVVL